MPKRVDRLLQRISRNVKSRPGRSKKSSAIAIAKDRGLVKQQGKKLKAGRALKRLR